MCVTSEISCLLYLFILVSSYDLGCREKKKNNVYHIGYFSTMYMVCLTVLDYTSPSLSKKNAGVLQNVQHY